SWARGGQSEGRDTVLNDARPGRAPLPLDLGRTARGGPRSGSTTRRVVAIGFANAQRAPRAPASGAPSPAAATYRPTGTKGRSAGTPTSSARAATLRAMTSPLST